MDKSVVVRKTVKHMKEKMSGESTGHDWWHVYRVWMLSKRIAKEEKGADTFIVELGALLHDIADWKFHGGDMTVGPKEARKWLESQGVDEASISRVCYIIENISFRGAGVKDRMESIEGRIVQDADRLDAIGAIGVARTFAYGGSRGRPMHEPASKPTLHASFKVYSKANSSTINHFYEKLLLLKGRMNTRAARKLALQRDRYMRGYLRHFYREWEGKE